MPLRILIVEDEALIALDLQEMLEDAGHKVVGHAVSMEEALRLAAKAKPDVALVDVGLKGEGNGLDTAEALGSRFRIPALFLTGSTDFRVRAMALDVEPLGYVVKPYLPDDILGMLAQK